MKAPQSAYQRTPACQHSRHTPATPKRLPPFAELAGVASSSERPHPDAVKHDVGGARHLLAQEQRPWRVRAVVRVEALAIGRAVGRRARRDRRQVPDRRLAHVAHAVALPCAAPASAHASKTLTATYIPC